MMISSPWCSVAFTVQVESLEQMQAKRSLPSGEVLRAEGRVDGIITVDGAGEDMRVSDSLEFSPSMAWMSGMTNNSNKKTKVNSCTLI